MAQFLAPTPIFICGAECGMATAGTAGVGVEHWSSITGSPTVVTSGPSYMRSTRCFRFNVAGSNAFMTHTFASAIAAPSTSVARFYVYFTTLPNADTDIFVLLGGGTGAGTCRFVTSDSTLRARINGNNAGGGVAISTNQWYRIDIKCVLNTTATCDISVNGVAQTQASVAGASETCTAFRPGIASSATADMYIDDIIISGTAADYPIGSGTVFGLYPKADGAHVYNANSDFGRDGTTLTSLNATSSAETKSWTGLTNPLSTTIDTTRFISNQTGASTEYLEWAFDTLPQNIKFVNGLMVVTTNHAASATACVATARLLDRGTTNDIYNLADFSETTIVTAVKTYATAPATPTLWTKAVVDGLRFRWGESNDVNPDPILDGVCFEVDCVTQTMPPDWALISLLFPPPPPGVAENRVAGMNLTEAGLLFPEQGAGKSINYRSVMPWRL